MKCAGGHRRAQLGEQSGGGQGRPPYTFADDHAGQVTGQGVQNFFVATPGLASITSGQTPASPMPPAGSGGGYGY